MYNVDIKIYNLQNDFFFYQTSFGCVKETSQGGASITHVKHVIIG